MKRFFYMQEQRLFEFSDGRSSAVECAAVGQYTDNLKQIQRKKEWKTQGTGAAFMGVYQEEADFDNIHPADAVVTADGRLIYGAVLQGGAAVQSKNTAAMEQAEGLILRHADCTICDMACDPAGKCLALSVADSWGERKLAILPLDNNRFQFVTEGECRDANPCFDPADGNILYYDTSGIAHTERGIVYSPRAVNRLNLADGTLDTVLHDEKFDYFQPQTDAQGNLWCIRRPYRDKEQTGGHGLRDMALAPVKIGKALFGWLDFFTQRYSGESLRTSGANPAKAKQQSEEEKFIEGNLVKVRQTKETAADGRLPAAIPKNWELVRTGADGGQTVLKHSVMAYALLDNGGFLYSDGRHIIRADADGSETVLLQTKWAGKLRPCPPTLADSPEAV